MIVESIASTPVWIGFSVFVMAALAFDLLVFQRNAHAMSMKEAGISSVIWLALALLFGVGMWAIAGSEPGAQYLTGYVVERSLSVDNLFVFALIFQYFAVPKHYVSRVLVWGIIIALVLRTVFIFAGAALLNSFEWMFYVFGALLLFTGVRLLTHKSQEVHPEHNPALRLLRKIVPMTKDYHGIKLFHRQGGRRMGTPLLAVVAVLATTDVVFAIDSIPAVFAITTDAFIVFAANAFALLGLRPLYTLVVGLLNRFVYLNVGLAIILMFVGAKMILEEHIHLPIWASLAFIASTLLVTMLVSLKVSDSGKKA